MTGDDPDRLIKMGVGWDMVKENDVKFTEEQLRGIDQVRSRLEGYRDRIQPYPDYPESEHSIIETHTPEPEWTKRQWDIVNQLRAQVLFLSSKVNEIRANASKKRKYKY